MFALHFKPKLIVAATIEYITANSPIAFVNDGRIAASNETQSNISALHCEYAITYTKPTGNVSDLCAGSARVRTAFTWTIAPAAAQPVRVISLRFQPFQLLPYDNLLVLDSC